MKTKQKQPRRQQRQRQSDVLARVRELAMNLWWTWNHDAQRLFESMDPPLWRATSRNPLKVLRLLPPERREAIENDTNFAAHLAHVEHELDRYLKSPTWFDRNYR